MDYLATFKDTQSVMQAEQIFIRREIPFETVPYSRYKRSGCGLAILFSHKYVEATHDALEEAQLSVKIIPVESPMPHENEKKR